ncbi:MAG: tRNA (adenosine(37)-N6)-dimethylallyltransferase MiaA [Candidatus Limnocylindrales bacterium]
MTAAGAKASPAVAPTSAPPLLVIAGATATGKTGLSLDIAGRLTAQGGCVEIVSADSRQVYRGLDIGTAKVGAADRARIRHHGLDLVDPDAPFSLSTYVDAVTVALAGIAARGGVAILVGGTGLYLRAVARGIPTAELPADPSVRAEIERSIATAGLAPAVARLSALAPTLAARTDPRNPRRVARALEIAVLQGDRPLPAPRGYPGPVAWLGLALETDRHRRWIAARARGQFEGGLLAEAADLRMRFDPGLRAFSAIGYREAWSVLNGNLSKEEAIDLDARRNVAFAARQRTWFRREPDVEWHDASDPAAALAAGLALVATLIERSPSGGRSPS